jgi:hypothetical protein
MIDTLHDLINRNPTTFADASSVGEATNISDAAKSARSDRKLL